MLGATGVALTAVLAGCSPTQGADVLRAPPSAPRTWNRTSWSRDPFARGSYSYLAPSILGPRARTILGQPVGRLAFAGEATSSSAPATTHGALQSGLDAASLVIEGGRSGDTVLIVGAGFAGLGAARALSEAGFDVIVVESRDRLGGRATTVTVDGYALDLGPSWIHGVTGNPMTSLAQRAGTARVSFDYGNSVGGNRAAEREVKDLFDRARQVEDPNTRTLSELVGEQRSATQQWAITEAVGHEFGADPGELAIAALDEGDELRGGDALLAGGYTSLITTLALGIDVRLGWPVASVEHNDDSVLVRSSTGAELRASAAVITLPVGVLASGVVQFSPPLPTTKSDALAALPMGLLDKLWLTFDDVFWNPDVDIINFIDPENPGLWAQWVNGYRAFGTPTLLAFNSSSVARRVANWSDEEVVGSAINAIARMA
jgi:polyamine oxidase